MTLSTPIHDHWTPKVKHSVAKLGSLQEMGRTCSEKLALWRPDKMLRTSTNGPSNMNTNKIDRLPVPGYTIKCHTIGDRTILSFYVPASRDSSSHAKFLETPYSVGINATQRCELV